MIGSVEANPWIQLFQPQMNCQFSINTGSDKPSGIVNSHPRVGEKAIYGTPGQDYTYGVIAYVPNLNSTGHVLIVGGLNTAGTQAATTFLLTPPLMMPTLRRARAAQGKILPFELLIGAENVATNASTPQGSPRTHRTALALQTLTHRWADLSILVWPRGIANGDRSVGGYVRSHYQRSQREDGRDPQPAASHPGAKKVV